MQAVFQDIPLHELAAVRFTKNQATLTAAHATSLPDAGTDRPRARVWNPRSSFSWVLKLSALSFLHSQRATHTTCDTVPHFLQNRCHFAPANGRLVLMRAGDALDLDIRSIDEDFRTLEMLIHLSNINEFVVPASHEKRFARPSLAEATTALTMFT